MSKRFGQAINGVAEPRRRNSHTGKITTVGSGGKSLSVTNANGSQLRDLIPISPYGISSSPPTGLMSFVIASGNSGSDGMVGVYDPNRPSCKPGECIMYSSGGATIKCTKDKVLINGMDIVKEIKKLKGEE